MDTDKELLEAARKLYEEQERLRPFLSIRRCAEILNTKSMATMQEILKDLVRAGLAHGYSFGDGKKHYRFRKPVEKPLEETE